MYIYFQCLKLYYKGGNASLIIFLPNKIEGLKDMQTKLEDPDVSKKVLSSFQNVQVEVYLPKTKIESTIDLGDVLQTVYI